MVAASIGIGLISLRGRHLGLMTSSPTYSSPVTPKLEQIAASNVLSTYRKSGSLILKMGVSARFAHALAEILVAYRLVCLFVCLFVCIHSGGQTALPIAMKLGRHLQWHTRMFNKGAFCAPKFRCHGNCKKPHFWPTVGTLAAIFSTTKSKIENPQRESLRNIMSFRTNPFSPRYSKNCRTR